MRNPILQRAGLLPDTSFSAIHPDLSSDIRILQLAIEFRGSLIGTAPHTDALKV
jgi:hypothetical protein